MFKPIFFEAREFPLIPLVDMICECELKDAVPILVSLGMEIIQIAEKYEGKLMNERPSFSPSVKNGVALSFKLIFPNMEKRERFLSENETGTIGSG